MYETDLISIVLPVYNGEKYLAESIQSIINQTYSKFELIIVNDCSSDNTEQIVYDFMSKDERISLINNKENQKLPQSLNIGFQAARGSYLTWTSDDNIYEPMALEKMLMYLKQNVEVGMVYTDMLLIDENGNVIGKRTSNDNDYYKFNCIGADFLYKKECRDIVGNYNPERFLVEDYDYWLRIANKFKIGHLSELLYKYRMHNNSLTFSKMRQVGEKLLELKINYLDDIITHSSQEELGALLFELTTYGLENDHIVCEKILSLTDNVKSVQWVLNRNRKAKLSKVWLFGAGAFGTAALKFIGEENILGIIDNNESKIGTLFFNKSISSLSDYINKNTRDMIVISTDVRNAYYIAKQLENNKIDNYLILYDIIKGNK